MKKYILPILLSVLLILANILCYKYNGRTLHDMTNISLSFLIILNAILAKFKK
jgi:uncharacterized membrane protein YoaK (UPF0700 family)